MNGYNLAPHLTHDTVKESDKNKRKHHIQESKENRWLQGYNRNGYNLAPHENRWLQGYNMNGYNLAPHLTHDTVKESDKNIRKHHIQESKENGWLQGYNRNGYNLAPHLTQDTVWESGKNIRIHHMQESQELIPYITQQVTTRLQETDIAERQSQTQ